MHAREPRVTVLATILLLLVIPDADRVLAQADRELQIAAPRADRQPSDGSGPFLPTVIGPQTVPSPTASRAPSPRTETFLDLPASVFLPGKADPRTWMATGTWARVTYDGFNYDYGYDPLAQTYDLMVSGYAVQGGILVQETVGVMAVLLPTGLQSGQIERVECWFRVSEHNLYPDEWVGITALEDVIEPSSSLNSLEARLLYEDARGFRGAAYAVDHFGAGAHAIDLGTVAVADFESALVGKGWFGVGFGADGWDLSGSLGQMVFWRIAGGGGLPENIRPLFRVVYNAPPGEFTALAPVEGARVPHALPDLSWSAAIDPNGDAPVSYRVRLGTQADLVQAVEFTVVDQTQAQPPVPLSSGTYYWRVDALDPQGAHREGSVQSFVVAIATDAPPSRSAASITCAPNPFNPRTEFRLSVPRAGTARVEVVDARGRRIRSVFAGWLASGPTTLVWDGKDDAGRACASGIYEVRAMLPGDLLRTRIALVR